VCVRSAKTGRPVCPPIPTRPSQTGVTFTPDSRRVVVAGYDGDVRFWDAATGQPVMTLVPPSATRTGDIAFTALPVFSAKNQRLVIMNHFGSYCTWDGRAEH
jgi:WD40 repeat protein